MFVPAELPKQSIQVPSGILLPDVRYTLIVKGLQDVDAEDHPDTTFRVVCVTKTLTYNPPIDEVQVVLVYEASNKVAVEIPRLLNCAVTHWKITIQKLTDSRNLPHANKPERDFETKRSGKPFWFPVRFQAGCTYNVKLRGFHDAKCKIKAQTIFRAELTSPEVETLYEKALDFVDRESHAPCRWLYRTKTLAYFEEILANGSIMKTYEKDYTGDPGSPINLKLKGLSFTVSVCTGSRTGVPIPVSPFGDTRLLVPAEELLERAPNLYFADVYCHGSENHHVMLVLTKPESEADLFCAKHIHRLDVSDNPFLFRDGAGKVQVSTSENLLVHVLFTNDLDINGYDLKRNIKVIGSYSDGIPKDRSCSKCNINHSLTKIKNIPMF